MSEKATHKVFAEQTLYAKQTAVQILEKMIRIMEFDETLGENDRTGNPVADIAKDLNDDRYNQPFYYGEDD